MASPWPGEQGRRAGERCGLQGTSGQQSQQDALWVEWKDGKKSWKLQGDPGIPASQHEEGATPAGYRRVAVGADRGPHDSVWTRV